jgi:hypothetical protein
MHDESTTEHWTFTAPTIDSKQAVMIWAKPWEYGWTFKDAVLKSNASYDVHFAESWWKTEEFEIIGKPRLRREQG